MFGYTSGKRIPDVLIAWNEADRSCKQCRIIGVILPLRPKVGKVTHLRLVMES